MLDGLRRRYREAMTVRVDFNSNGIRRVQGRGILRPPLTESRAWADIRSVSVFKVDASTTDCITLLFEGRAPMFAIDESMDGWDDLIRYLPVALPGIQPFEDWFMAVAFPAFEPNPTVIYRRV